MFKHALVTLLVSAVAGENTTLPYTDDYTEIGAYKLLPATPDQYIAAAMDVEAFTNPTTPVNCGDATTAFVYNYETVGSTHDNIGCIGGHGGSPFQFHRYGSTVKTLQVWVANSPPAFKCMRTTFFDNTVHVQGICPTGNPTGQFHFASGERIVGDITVSGNGIGTRVGYMAFRTSMNNNFAVGNANNQHYYMASGSGYLSGFFGRANQDIDMLGFQFIKPLQSERLVDITYPTLDSIVAPNAPTRVTSYTGCNLSNETRPMEITADYSRTEGESYTFTTRDTFSFGFSFSVTAKVPLVAETSAGYEWGVSHESTMAHTVENKETIGMSYTSRMNVPAYTISSETITQWDEYIDLPYDAKYEIVTLDGNRALFPSSGTYMGVYVSTVNWRFDPNRSIDEGTATCNVFEY
jgi:hypothetical protein